MNKTEKIQDSQRLLGTIKLDNNLNALGKKLPSSNYGDTNIHKSVSEPRYNKQPMQVVKEEDYRQPSSQGQRVNKNIGG